MEHKEPWVEAFEQEFPEFGYPRGRRNDKMISFIRSLLASSRDAALAEAIEVLKKAKWDDDGQVEGYDERNRVAFYSHNKALEDSAAALSALRESK